MTPWRPQFESRTDWHTRCWQDDSGVRSVLTAEESAPDVELVTEVARQSPFPVNAETTLAGQLWILHQQIAAELEASLRAPIVITDRSVLDNYCYLVNKFDRQPQLETWLAWWMTSYSLLIGVPTIQEEIPRDGFPLRRPRISIAYPQFADRTPRLSAFQQFVRANNLARCGKALQLGRKNSKRHGAPNRKFDIYSTPR